MFETIPAAPADPILGLTEAFKNDSNPKKINLGVGVYKDASGSTPVLASVREAEARLSSAGGTKSYLPITGNPAYGAHVQRLLFGEGHAVIEEKKAVTAHSPGGTGALRVGGDFIHHFMPEASIWVSSPTWANHKAVFNSAGLPIREYRYYDAETKALDFEGLCRDLREVPAGDVVLLHVCCHNPTGVDPSPEQWREIAAIAQQAGWIPFLDFAYQGFGEGLEEDRAAVVTLAEAGLEMLIASSFSKNFGLYCERVGAFTLVASSAGAASNAFSQVKRTIRTNYSNPPAHGGAIVTTILDDEGLRNQWQEELASMRNRIHSVRRDLVEALAARGVPGDFSFIADQRGMFSFSGLGDTEVDFLKNEKGIYIVRGGRINVAGITPENLDYLCDSIAEALSR